MSPEKPCAESAWEGEVRRSVPEATVPSRPWEREGGGSVLLPEVVGGGSILLPEAAGGGGVALPEAAGGGSAPPPVTSGGG
eukprot:341907-Prymnesium_polylepis.1